jgi:hypothetical protein
VATLLVRAMDEILGTHRRTGKAITIQEKVAADLKRVLGPEHPDTLAAKVSLAFLYWSAGHTSQAVTVLKRVAADRERLLGPDHPDTRIAQRNLAMVKTKRNKRN